MNRKKKILRNIIIIALVYTLGLKTRGLYLDPIKAYRASERSDHYGPSEIVHIEDFLGGKYILGKYDKWFSCNTVKRYLFGLWTFGSHAAGELNKLKEPISYTWSGNDKGYKLYGIVNDDRITKIELILDDGQVLTQEELYEDMFLFTWPVDEGGENFYDIIRGLSKDGKPLYEDVRPR